VWYNGNSKQGEVTQMGSVRIAAGLEERIRQVVARKGITRSEVYRQALETYCDRELAPPRESRFDDVIGVVDVPGDFSAHARELIGGILDEKARR
jgi:hypothetical protein